MTDTVGFLVSALRDLGARSVIDMGCGDGAIAEALAGKGFDVTGVEPAADMLVLARRRLPDATLLQGCAEDLDAGPATYDVAYFVNSLHHVAEARMRDALLNAARMIRPGGRLLVVEPMPEGSFFCTMRPVEDETAIREAAARTIEALVSEGRLLLHRVQRWDRESRFAGTDDFVACLTRVSPQRAALARDNADALDLAWRDNARSAEGGAVLVQPMIGWILAPPKTL
jgi:SAM-dependent methyltransferase